MISISMPKDYIKMSATNRRTLFVSNEHNQNEQDQQDERFQSTPELKNNTTIISTAPAMSRLFIISALLLVVASIPTKTMAIGHSVFTYSNASSTLGQLVTSSTLEWKSYDPIDAGQLQYAVEGGKYITDDEHYPIYVCRVRIEGVLTSGHTEKIAQQHVCVAAHYKHNKYENFDVLINKGHLGKIAWKHWRKFNAGIPVGSISIEEGAYIARHKAIHQPAPGTSGTSEEDHRGADYNLGRLDSVGLGKINVMENDREKNYDEGEVLVETEPFRYELRDIKLDPRNREIRENITILATGVLVNRDDKYSVVETVMSYEFNHVQYWGVHDGLARGLPTKIYEKDAAHPAEINWALRHVMKRFETKSVNTKLWPGTALNVTLRGNYVSVDATYSAKLYVFYYNSEENVSRKINAQLQKSYLKDIKLEYSPVYWIDNGTFVPTTTTTTSSTTSTTTHATTTSRDVTPLSEPPNVIVKHIGEVQTGDPVEKSLKESTHENEISSEMPENLKHQKPAVAGVAAGSSAPSILSNNSLLAWCLSTIAIALTVRGSHHTHGNV